MTDLLSSKGKTDEQELATCNDYLDPRRSHTPFGHTSHPDFCLIYMLTIIIYLSTLTINNLFKNEIIF